MSCCRRPAPASPSATSRPKRPPRSSSAKPRGSPKPSAPRRGQDFPEPGCRAAGGGRGGGPAGKTRITNLPGSTNGVKEGRAVLAQFLDHAVDLVTGTNTSHALSSPSPEGRGGQGGRTHGGQGVRTHG